MRYDSYPPGVDHIIAGQHRGLDDPSNLALCRWHCNSYKGPNVAGIDPVIGSLTRLFNPRGDLWADHFVWASAEMAGTTAIGRVTVYVLAVNEPLRKAARAQYMRLGQY